MIPITRQEITIRKGPLYFVVAIFIIFLLILNDTKRINNTSSLFAAGGLLLFGVIYYILSKNKLIIDNDGISQELFFGKTKELKWGEIKSAGLNWHYHGHGANLEWEFLGYDGKKITIQPPFYSRKKIRLIAEALISKSPNAATDKRVKNIATGKFPWYIF